MGTHILFDSFGNGQARADAGHRAAALAIDAEEGDIDLVGEGRVHYYADARTRGRAVVLVHSINAAASSYEMRPLFEALRATRRVYALDLPGFGLSARDRRAYTREGYARAIERFVVDVASPQGAPCDVVALSLSCEFVARAALSAPALFHRLTFLSPTGLGREAGSGLARSLRGRALSAALSMRPLARGLFELVTTERSVRYFLKKSFVGPVDEGLVAYAVRSAREGGAEHAPTEFLKGALFTPDAAASLYGPLRVPTEVLYDGDPFTGFDKLAGLVAANPGVHATRVAPSRGMPQFEHTAAVVAAIDRETSPARRT